MTKSLNSENELFSEAEAAGYLNISISYLHSILDEHIFNDGSHRPEDLTFCESDLVLLGFWKKSRENPKIIRMPRRN